MSITLVHIPTDGRSVERVSETHFSRFLTSLDRERGGFLRQIGKALDHFEMMILFRNNLELQYTFESLDDEQIRGVAPDSCELLELCSSR